MYRALADRQSGPDTRQSSNGGTQWAQTKDPCDQNCDVTDGLAKPTRCVASSNRGFLHRM
jgi:hypothetical protein